MEQVLSFPKGNVYNIICKAGDYSLRILETETKKYEKSRVSGVKQNPQDDGQLFMIDKVGLKDDDYEIVNLQSSMVFD